MSNPSRLAPMRQPYVEGSRYYRRYTNTDKIAVIAAVAAPA